MRVDLHSHTRYSLDATTTPQQLVQRAREAGLDRIAVTDHGEIEGALRARELDPALVIVGEEIRCRCGVELIGLFLTEGSVAKQLFVQYRTFGFGPTALDLIVFDITLGFYVHVNLMSVIGIFLVAQILRWYR